MNKVIISGNITHDIELRTTPNGIAVVNFSIAVNRRNGKGTETVTDFIEVVAWRKTAEFVAKYFEKGRKILVTGSLQTRNWKDAEGNNRKWFEVVADEVDFADSKTKGSGFVKNDTKEDDFETIDGDDFFPFK